MADTPTTPDTDETQPTPVPVATLITTLLTLFVFAGLVALVYYYSNRLDSKPPVVSGEDQLKELRASEQAILANYGYEEATKTWRIPIEDAKNRLIETGEAKGILPFPRIPEGKMPEKSPEPKPSEKKS